MLPVIVYPVALGALAGLAYLTAKNQTGIHGEEDGLLTPQRQIVYDLAMTKLKDPNQILKLAVVFGQEGLGAHANALRKRAALSSMPQHKKNAYRATFRRAMHSNNKQAVMGVAAAFGAEGALGAQAALEKYADGISEEDTAPGDDPYMPGDAQAGFIPPGAGHGGTGPDYEGGYGQG